MKKRILILALTLFGCDGNDKANTETKNIVDNSIKNIVELTTLCYKIFEKYGHEIEYTNMTYAKNYPVCHYKNIRKEKSYNGAIYEVKQEQWFTLEELKAIQKYIDLPNLIWRLP